VSFFNKDTHIAVHATENAHTAMMSGDTVNCCEIQESNNSATKQLVSAVIFENKTSGYGAILLAGLIFVFLLKLLDCKEKLIASRIYYLRQRASIWGNYLLAAFSRGILQPKIYNAAV
jgi:hypothetical protein